MTAHVVFAAIDPSGPATTSRRVFRRIIRGELDYRRPGHVRRPVHEGAVRNAAPSAPRRRSAAGCDVALHCNGGSRRDAPGRRGGAGHWAACAGGVPRPRWPAYPAHGRAVRSCGRPRAGSTACLRWRPEAASCARGACRGPANHGTSWRTSSISRIPHRIDKGDAEPALIVDVDGFAGPLDLLLELARRQKIDLHRISVLALAEQYLAFVEQARSYRLELAADYLVMAAWLAYLKSRLLLPEPPKGEEPTAQRPGRAALAFRLQRLEAMREASRRLVDRNAAGPGRLRARHAGAGRRDADAATGRRTLFDLLSAYARERQKHAHSRVHLPRAAFLVARGCASGAGAPRRRGGGLDGAGRVSDALRDRAGHEGAP